jgi:hypothetical protein
MRASKFRFYQGHFCDRYHIKSGVLVIQNYSTLRIQIQPDSHPGTGALPALSKWQHVLNMPILQAKILPDAIPKATTLTELKGIRMAANNWRSTYLARQKLKPTTLYMAEIANAP